MLTLFRWSYLKGSLGSERKQHSHEIQWYPKLNNDIYTHLSNARYQFKRNTTHWTLNNWMYDKSPFWSFWTTINVQSTHTHTRTHTSDRAKWKQNSQKYSVIRRKARSSPDIIASAFRWLTAGYFLVNFNIEYFFSRCLQCLFFFFSSREPSIEIIIKLFARSVLLFLPQFWTLWNGIERERLTNFVIGILISIKLICALKGSKNGKLSIVFGGEGDRKSWKKAKKRRKWE